MELLKLRNTESEMKNYMDGYNSRWDTPTPPRKRDHRTWRQTSGNHLNRSTQRKKSLKNIDKSPNVPWNHSSRMYCRVSSWQWSLFLQGKCLTLSFCLLRCSFQRHLSWTNARPATKLYEEPGFPPVISPFRSSLCRKPRVTQMTDHLSDTAFPFPGFHSCSQVLNSPSKSELKTLGTSP